MGNFLIGMINLIIKLLGVALLWVFNLLPPSPFNVIDNTIVAQYLPSINWIFPIDQMIVILESWLGAILIYYSYMVILRFLKAIE